MKRTRLLQVATVVTVAAATASAAAQPVTDAEACLAPGPAPGLLLGLCERALAAPGLAAPSRATKQTHP